MSGRGLGRVAVQEFNFAISSPKCLFAISVTSRCRRRGRGMHKFLRRVYERRYKFSTSIVYSSR